MKWVGMEWDRLVGWILCEDGVADIDGMDGRIGICSKKPLVSFGVMNITGMKKKERRQSVQ